MARPAGIFNRHIMALKQFNLDLICGSHSMTQYITIESAVQCQLPKCFAMTAHEGWHCQRWVDRPRTSNDIDIMARWNRCWMNLWILFASQKKSKKDEANAVYDNGGDLFVGWRQARVVETPSSSANGASTTFFNEIIASKQTKHHATNRTKTFLLHLDLHLPLPSPCLALPCHLSVSKAVTTDPLSRRTLTTPSSSASLGRHRAKKP